MQNTSTEFALIPVFLVPPYLPLIPIPVKDLFFSPVLHFYISIFLIQSVFQVYVYIMLIFFKRPNKMVKLPLNLFYIWFIFWKCNNVYYKEISNFYKCFLIWQSSNLSLL
jgi:hypothetical protein